MKLDRLILVNWGQLRPGHFEMGDMTLLTGETGSGKSTLLDALQTIMTAAYKGILNYNPGQDEVSQGQRRGKTRRTLESYIVGAEYNHFSRPHGAQGYMAAVFRPDAGEDDATPFTALVAASARVEGAGESRHPVLESMTLVIVDDAALTFEDFMRDVGSQECMPVDTIARHLQTRYRKVHDFHDRKMDYLCALYGRFRGRASVTRDEASNAAKAWVQSIAYRPIGSVHELVRDEILDFDEKQLQQDIERISGLMRQVSQLRQKSQRLQTSVSDLSVLQERIGAANQAHEAHVLQGLLVAKLQRQADEALIASRQQTIQHAREDQREAQELVANARAHGSSLDTQRVNLTAQLQGIAVHHQKRDLEVQRDTAVRQAQDCLTALEAALRSTALLDQKARTLLASPLPEGFPALKDALNRVEKAHRKADLGQLAEAAEQVAQAAAQAIPEPAQLQALTRTLAQAQGPIDALLDSILGPENGVLIAVAAESVHWGQQLHSAENREKEWDAQRARLASGKVTFPAMVERGLSALQQEFPEANAQVLCDLVEPQSLKWQGVIEGFMAGARFNLIVDPAWERRCVDYLKSQRITAKVIQGERCLQRAERKALPADSIVHELKSANPIAWAYLVDQFGSVVKAAHTEALRSLDRGITLDGIAAASRTLFTLDRVAPVFGLRAREDALDKARKELEAAQADVQRLRTAKATLDAIRNTLQTLRPVRLDANPLKAAGQQIQSANASLARLDVTELQSLQEALNGVLQEIADNDARMQQATRREVQCEATIRAAEAAIRDLQAQQQLHLMQLESQLQSVKELISSNPALVYSERMARVEQGLQEPGLTLGNARNQLDALAPQPDDRAFEVREALGLYNSHADADERLSLTLQPRQDGRTFAANYQALLALQSTVTRTLENLRGVGLYHSRQELSQAERAFHDVFTKQFCVEIKSRVDDGVRTLRQMNHELRNLQFGADSFTIDFHKFEPEYQDYLRFFEAVTELADAAEPVDLFGTTELGDKHTAIRDRLVRLLLDEDQDRATKELLRIADYRNYRRYDIINQTTSGARVKLSEWGTGSGGQLETPAYIVRAAVVTNRLKLFEKGPSLKLLVNDESFAKMDETRARAVLGFLRDKLKLQIISAMPTMKAGALKDEFNREYSFTRLKGVANGELDFISECDERWFKNDAMRLLWERQRLLAREAAKQLFDAENPEIDLV